MDWGVFTWPATFLLTAVLIALLVNARVRQWLDQRAKQEEADQACDQLEIESKAKLDTAAALERQNAAELAAATHEERENAERARLVRQAAEDRVAAEVAAELKPDRLVAEQKALAAYTEGRIEAERKRGRTEGAVDHTQPSDFSALMKAYEAMVGTTSSTLTMGQWLQGSGIVIRDGKVSHRG